MFECFHCLARAVTWNADFDYSDYGIYDRAGIVQVCHCENCGAEIYYYIDCGELEEGGKGQ